MNIAYQPIISHSSLSVLAVLLPDFVSSAKLQLQLQFRVGRLLYSPASHPTTHPKKVVLSFNFWECLNVGTVPTYKMHNIGTVLMFKMHNVGTVPMFKMHNVGTPKIYDLHFELEFGLYGKNK